MTDLPNHRWELGTFENPGDWAAGLRDFVAVPCMLDFLRSLQRVGNALDEIVRCETNDAVVEEDPIFLGTSYFTSHNVEWHGTQTTHSL